MSDQGDQALLRNVGESLADMLSAYGLRRASNLKVTPNPYTKGWCMHVANWSRERPTISVWLDHTLGGRLAPFLVRFPIFPPRKSNGLNQRASWQNRIQRKSQIKDWIETDDGEIGILNQSALEEVKRAGLWYEHYTDLGGRYDYFGIAEDALHLNSRDELVPQAASFIGEIVEYVDPRLVEDKDVEEIKKSESDPSVRQALIWARRGQGKFRANLIERWGGCAVLKFNLADVLRASHIRPWKKCEGKNQKLDPDNGLLLSATLDALFDRGFISFKDDGGILISPRLSKEDRERLGLDESMTLSKPLRPEQSDYMKFHREFEFKKKQE